MGYRILILNTLMEAGGAQKAMLQLAQGLRDRGHDVVVATMYDKGGFIPKFEQKYGMPIIDLQMKPAEGNPLVKALAFARGLFRLTRLMRRERIEVLQTFSHYSNILGPILGLLARVPVRVSSQRMSLLNQPRWLLFLDRLVTNSRLVHRMVSVSEMTRRYTMEVERIRGDKLITIPNGIDVSGFSSQLGEEGRDRLRTELGLGKDDLVVSVVARLHPQKGHRYLIEAIPSILAHVPNAVFLLAGDGALRDELDQAIDRAGVGHAVRLLGARNDVPDLLSISSLFVLPSLWEGMPNAVMEAMAAGLPVVATSVDGTPEVVLDGETGLLVPAKDPGALGSAIIELLLDGEKRRAFGAAGRERISQTFSLQSYVDRHEALYSQLVRQVVTA